jgi:hypothetical protein
LEETSCHVKVVEIASRTTVRDGGGMCIASKRDRNLFAAKRVVVGVGTSGGCVKPEMRNGNDEISCNVGYATSTQASCKERAISREITA